MTDYQHPAREPGPQPDPMLRPGTMGGMWMWLIGVVIVGVVVATLFAFNPPNANTAVNMPTSQTTGTNTTAPAARVTTGAATGGVPAPRTIPPAAPAR